MASRLRSLERPLHQNLLTLALVGASIWVGINGHLYRDGDVPVSICGTADGSLCLYTPETSPLWVHFVFPKELDPGMRVMAGTALAGFLWMSAPLFGRLAGQVRQSARALWAAHGWRRGWKL